MTESFTGLRHLEQVSPIKRVKDTARPFRSRRSEDPQKGPIKVARVLGALRRQPIIPHDARRKVSCPEDFVRFHTRAAKNPGGTFKPASHFQSMSSSARTVDRGLFGNASAAAGPRVCLKLASQLGLPLDGLILICSRSKFVSRICRPIAASRISKSLSCGIFCRLVTAPPPRFFISFPSSVSAVVAVHAPS